MGDVVRMDGCEIEQDAPGRNPEIAHILEELYDLNNKGLLDAVIVGAVKNDMSPISYASTPRASNIATVLGAIHLAEIFYTQHLCLRAVDSHLPSSPEGA